MSHKYKKSGFTVEANRNVMFFKGRVICDQLIRDSQGISIIPISDSNLKKVIQYDRNVCGIDRKIFIEGKYKSGDTATAVAFNDSQEVVGFAIVGASNQNNGLIEPLYANNREIAELLLFSVCQSMTITAEVGLIYKVFHTNTESIDLAKKAGLEYSGEEDLLFTKRVEESIIRNERRIFCLSGATFYPTWHECA